MPGGVALGAIGAAIPNPLLDDEYNDLYRVWLLIQHEVYGPPSWRLLGKARLSGEVSEFCNDLLRDSTLQDVYGATREMLNVLGRSAAGAEET